ncbi:tRNA 2-thiouridine(34) synthase MnmA [Candidatus Riesia pediculicola]|uniref:tRNA-specific 2-thiouridylase MnmA n=1 Tax=Riesia pediculicola (strain USDA) TaxID=515618 RepID=D4G7Z1_RIEPU|nr:tRNA 2-thiouridine(34) synthase MnmA [Candidatus Riesia pediculicola]ADD79687.1 tRNA (5-methylaminomethyl-2-thiouridylate)-methyltransferase [Candidatus Riesia pediculicola USDA]ARC53704.1 tRNA 2-thiouridylase [Candidatus Riesia pediculicola]QOJ86347.1 tRNA 2-thiouridine(34) synthase MnmA [Candidatus Riesia pediculicola]
MKNKKNYVARVVVGMSGGVDSSVAALLLKKRNYEVLGLFMKNWEEDDGHSCSYIEDLKDVKSVCEKLKIQLYQVNFSIEYWNKVFKVFLKKYKTGKTPNPDVLCNKEIKFKEFLDFSLENLNADYIATGHYVRKKKRNEKYILLKAKDERKDQSYFLHLLDQSQLEKVIFPIGEFKKSEIRKIAEKNGLLSVSKKKDSTGICFIGKKRFENFLQKYISCKNGDILSVHKEIIGQHPGSILYTLGQRKGIRIGGIKNEKHGPWYVIDKNVKQNTIMISQNKFHPSLVSKGIIINNVHWISEPKYRCSVQTRYHQKETYCSIRKICLNRISVRFDHPILSVTPGQYGVFYDREVCLGGGEIDLKF